MLDEMLQQNTSKFDIFLKHENPIVVLFCFSFDATLFCLTMNWRAYRRYTMIARPLVSRFCRFQSTSYNWWTLDPTFCIRLPFQSFAIFLHPPLFVSFDFQSFAIFLLPLFLCLFRNQSFAIFPSSFASFLSGLFLSNLCSFESFEVWF